MSRVPPLPWALALALACGAPPEPLAAPGAPRTPAPPVEPLALAVRVLASFPHDSAAFTQGLLWHRGTLFESTGRYGESSLRRVELESGRVLDSVSLPGEYFGEGLARVGERLIQLTWQEGVAFVYDLELTPTDEHHYAGEGWGLCADGERLVMSDGSPELTFRDPATFAENGRLTVTLEGEPVSRLNELECAEGWIYANVLHGDEIVRIDPLDGRVVATIDASGLLAEGERVRADALNGIAYVPERSTFLLTGKLWPRVFEVVFVPRD